MCSSESMQLDSTGHVVLVDRHVHKWSDGDRGGGRHDTPEIIGLIA